MGVEALVRWRHPERGIVLPDDFIPFAEQHGLIGRIDSFVLNEACRQLAEWTSRDGWPSTFTWPSTCRAPSCRTTGSPNTSPR